MKTLKPDSEQRIYEAGNMKKVRYVAGTHFIKVSEKEE